MRASLLLSLLLLSFTTLSQPGYYQFPIQPGERNFFAGTLGELRDSHFHGGLDIKTNGVEGLPVYAAAAGYVVRARVSGTGYGNVLYLKHPNGHSTVYAHLQGFRNDIDAWVLAQQYQKRSFEIDLNLSPNQFPVKKGDLIAYSGNTGSSSAPHLHFEIRDEQDRPMNPVAFGFSELKDQIAPTLHQIAVVPLDIQARVNGTFEKLWLTPLRKAGPLTVSTTPLVLGRVGIEIVADDQADGSSNRYGINEVEVEVNGKLVYRHRIDRVPFEMNRYMHIFTDYQDWIRSRTKSQRCYRLPGNQLPIFPETGLDGIIQAEAGKLYRVRLRLMDSFGNATEALLNLEGGLPAAAIQANRALPEVHTFGNVLQIAEPFSTARAEAPMTVFAGHFQQQVPPSYRYGSQQVYHWDLAKALPDSLHLPGSGTVLGNFKIVVPWRARFVYYDTDLTFQFPEDALFEPLYLQATLEPDGFTVNDPLTPLFTPVTIHYRPRQAVAYPAKTAIYSVSRSGRLVYEGGKWEGDRIVFQTRTLGRFVLRADNTPPTIRNVGKGMFRIADDLSGIRQISATLNGEWVMMVHDAKKGLITVRPPAGVPLSGKLVVSVTDAAGNQASVDNGL